MSTLKISEILADSGKTGMCQVIGKANGVVACLTVSTGNEWLIPQKTFAQRVNSGEFEVQADDNSFKFAGPSLKERYEGK